MRCRNENKPLWLVPFRVKREELLRVSDVLEQIQMGRILREGFFWPFDLVRSDEMQGYVLHPFSMDAYPSVRRFLPSSDTPRWTIAVHLFRRIGQLHREGLTLNGFGRDQVRVGMGQTRCIWFRVKQFLGFRSSARPFAATFCLCRRWWSSSWRKMASCWTGACATYSRQR
ncbi:MAG: hypothetical protein ACLR5H_07375 [Oscillospiraceae bacterium]